MKWGALAIGLLFSAAGFVQEYDTWRIMGTVWLATSVILATIQRKA